MGIYSLIKSLLEDKKNTLVSLIVISVSVSTFYVFMFSKFGPSQHVDPGTDYQTYNRIAEILIDPNENINEYHRSSRVPIGYPLYLVMIF